MNGKDGNTIKLPVEELQIGHFVDLERSWMDHPFLFSRFKIKTLAELAAIRGMGLSAVTVLLDRSDPGLADGSATPEAVPASEIPADSSPEQDLWKNKKELVDRASGFRNERQEAASRYEETVRKISAFSRDLRTTPANAVHAAGEIVDHMVKSFTKEASVLVNLVNLNDTGFDIYNHSLNVTVLSMLLGRQLGLDEEDLRSIGMGALIHDVGKIEIPGRIVYKTGPLTSPEESLLRTHPLHGSKLGQRIRTLSPAVIAIIEQHHEYIDGSGYPRNLSGDKLSPLVRLVAVTNIYDNLCNPPDSAKALSPRDAMAYLYKNYSGKLDPAIVSTFIKAMGVYPPGTVVRLNDENVGMVVSVDPDQLLRPRIILYNPDIPRKDALMVDLRERPDLEVKAVLKPNEAPTRIYEYLGLSERVGYIHKNQTPGQK
jgi:putative nucleotidyltransferase with HDIG domain